MDYIILMLCQEVSMPLEQPWRYTVAEAKFESFIINGFGRVKCVKDLLDWCAYNQEKNAEDTLQVNKLKDQLATSASVGLTNPRLSN